MSFEDDILRLQRFAGVIQDGDFGPLTARALVVKLGLDAPAPTLMVAVDAGHGQDNKKMGVYDTGCVDNALEEADVTLGWARELVAALHARNISTFETRPDEDAAAPVGTRASRAKAAGATHFISIHVNDADSAAAHGTETLYRDDSQFAQRIHDAAMQGLQLTDRGIKQRNDLAVLNFQGQACLIELGFIKNAGDVARFTDPAVIRQTCRLIAGTLGGMGHPF